VFQYFWVCWISTCNARFGSSQKMIHHKCSSNMAQNFYFHHLPRLWNSFPKIDLSLPIHAIKQKLYNYMWEHFLNNFVNSDFHYKWPCSHYITTSMTPLYRDLTRYIYIYISFLYALFVFVGVLASWLSVPFSYCKRLIIQSTLFGNGAMTVQPST